MEASTMEALNMEVLNIQTLQRPKHIIIGHHNPAIFRNSAGKLMATTGDAWHELPEHVQSLSDIKFVPDFETFACQFEPFDFEQWTLHREMLKSNSDYHKLFKLFLQQQYLKHHQIDLVPDNCKFLPDVTMEQIVAFRNNITKPVNDSIVTKQVQSSKVNETYTVSFNMTTGIGHCTCKGFEFRKTCKHVNELIASLKK